MKMQSLLARIVLASTVNLVVLTLLIAGFSLYTTQQYLQKEAMEKVAVSYQGVQSMLAVYKENALAHASTLSHNVQVIDAAKRRDVGALFTITTPLMKEGKLDYLVVTDPKGIVLMRTHEPGKIPKADDSIASQINIAQAMQGKPFVGIEEGKVVKMSVRAGAPLYDETGTLVGILSTGYVVSQNRIVEQAKELFNTEVALFLGEEAVAATLKDGAGKSLVGEKETNDGIVQKVLKEGQLYLGENKVMGTAYFSAYGPLEGASGKHTGMIGIWMPVSLISQVMQSLGLKIALASLVVLGVVLAGGLLHLRRLLQPIPVILGRMTEIAEGNLSGAELPVTSEDEMGKLSEGCNVMLQKLRTLIQEVAELAEQVAEFSTQLNENYEQAALATEQIAVSVTQVSKGAQVQMQAVENTGKVVNQMNLGIEEISSHANLVADSSCQSAETAKKGRLVVEKAIGQMSQLEQSVLSSAAVVARLGERSKEIGSIIDTIAAIAGQTNLLALNAAIEAARAGEQGRGFAVVAEEVRKLAEQSQTAAKQISHLIAAIQSDTTEAVVSMQQGTNEVALGTGVVKEADQSFQEIFGSVNDVSRQITEISQAIEKVAQGSKQVVLAAQKIEESNRTAVQEAHSVSTSTEQQYNTMEKIAASSFALTEMSEQLTKAIRAFKM